MEEVSLASQMKLSNLGFYKMLGELPDETKVHTCSFLSRVYLFFVCRCVSKEWYTFFLTFFPFLGKSIKNSPKGSVLKDFILYVPKVVMLQLPSKERLIYEAVLSNNVHLINKIDKTDLVNNVKFLKRIAYVGSCEGHTRIFQFLRNKNRAAISWPCIEQAVIHGNINILEWINFSHEFLFLDEDEHMIEPISELFLLASEYGHLNILKWLKKHKLNPRFENEIFGYEMLLDYLETSIDGEFIDVTKWLLTCLFEKEKIRSRLILEDLIKILDNEETNKEILDYLKSQL